MSVAHSTTIGSNREFVWKNLFERIVPKKFKIDSNVFIIDSEGNCSREVDMAIYDEQYTPYIFNYGLLKFIPVEAVAAVIESKSHSLKKDSLDEWCDYINDLKTSQDSVVRIAGRIAYGNNEVYNDRLNTQTATKPIKILCYISKSKEKNIESDLDFDIIIAARETKEKLEISYRKDFNNLYDWYCELNHYPEGKEKVEKVIKEEEGANGISDVVALKNEGFEKYEIKDVNSKKNLLSFIFEFNQLLMLINNPIFFPHKAYVKMFNKHLNPKAQENLDSKDGDKTT